MAKQVYLWTIVITYIYIIITTIIDARYSALHIATAVLSITVSYLFCYFLYSRYRRNTYKKRTVFFHVNYKRFNWFITVFLIVMIIYALLTGDRKAASQNVNSSSIFASLFPVDGIFLYYFCICRKKYKTEVRFNSALLIIYKMILGFVGDIWIIFIFELYFMFGSQKVKLYKLIPILVAAFVLGGALYSVLSPLKFAIRYGNSFKMSDRLGLYEGIKSLCERFSHMSTTLYSIKNFDSIAYSYNVQNIFLMEFKSFFRPLIPSFIFKNKYFLALGNIIHNAVSGYTGTNGSDSPAIFTFCRMLMQIDFPSFLGWIFLIIISFAAIKYICNCFQTYDDQFEIFYFWLFVNSFSICGNLSSLFSDTYLKVIFFIPLLLLIGVIKIEKIRSNKS